MKDHRQVRIACTPSVLWKHLTEPELLKEWVPDYVDETPDGPVHEGVGAASTMRLREGSKVVAYKSVVTAWERERRVAIRITGGSFPKGMHIDVGYGITPSEGGCLLDYDVDYQLRGFFRLMAPIMWLATRGNSDKALTKLASAATRRT